MRAGKKPTSTCSGPPGDVLDNDIKAICCIPHPPALAEIAAAATGHRPTNLFSLPAPIEAHQTVAGSLVFSLDDKVIFGIFCDDPQQGNVSTTASRTTQVSIIPK